MTRQPPHSHPVPFSELGRLLMPEAEAGGCGGGLGCSVRISLGPGLFARAQYLIWDPVF